MQGNPKKPLQKQGGGQASQHDHADGGNGLHGVHDRRDPPVLQVQKIQDRADGKAEGDENLQRPHEQAEALQHPGRTFSKAQNQKQGAYQQDGEPAKKLKRAEAEEQAPEEKAGRHGDQSDDDAFEKIAGIILLDDADANGQSEGEGAAEYRSHDDAEKTAPVRSVCQLHGKLVAAHVDGKKSARQRGIGSEKAQKGSEQPLQQKRKGGRDTDHARHGKGGWPQKPEGFFKPLPISLFVSCNTVKTAQHGCSGKKYHDNPVHGIPLKIRKK